MTSALWSRFETWVTRRERAQRSAIRLDRRRIYILPTGYGYVYALMLVIMFLWAVNYNNSMGFAMTFLLAAIGLNALYRCHGNLLNLRIHPGSAEPAFAGQTAAFTFVVENPNPRNRYGVALQWRDGSPQYGDIPASGSARIALAIAAPRRGLLRLGRIRVLTRFPLGLLQAWSWVEFDQSWLVYPRPYGTQPLPVDTAAAGYGSDALSAGSEDYAGLRAYVRGDSPRHVAWKAAARQDELLVKRFTGQAGSELWLDWCDVAQDNPELRLSQLCQWVLKAEAEGRRYGLRLPDGEWSPNPGDEHRRRCLEALALYGQEPDG